MRGQAEFLVRTCALALAVFALVVAASSDAGAQVPGQPAYVDDNAPNDPGPDDPNVSDPLADGSAQHPFDTINKAIDYFLNPCWIVLAPGLYVEDVRTPGMGCLIEGGGSGVTTIRAASGNVLDIPIEGQPGTPEIPNQLSIRDVTLQGGPIFITGFATSDPNTPLDLSFENVVLNGASLTVRSSGDRYHLVIRSSSVIGSDITVLAQGAPVDVTLDSVVMPSGTVRLQASGVPMNVDLRSFGGHGATLLLERNGGGMQTVLAEDGALGSVTSAGHGYVLDATFRGTAFYGSGITIQDTPVTLSVTDCTFDQGGLDLAASTNIDVGTDSQADVTGSVFNQDGVRFAVTFNPSFNSVSYFARLHVDRSRFLQTGVAARLNPGGLSSDGSMDFKVTNSLFSGAADGGSVTYLVPDSCPGCAKADIRAAFVNNTFLGASTGIRYRMNVHAPGQHSIASIIQNNIIARGQVGIDINETIDQTLIIAGNDVFGNSVSNYVGIVPDQTGINGNISADPLLVDAPGGDFRLQGTSPCVDAAAANALTPSADHAGAPRPIDGNLDSVALPDIGAFEFSPDADGDGHFFMADCDDANPLIWSIPGEVPSLDVLGDTLTLRWTAAAFPGSAADAYDTLRATNSTGFMAATCVESNDPSDLLAQDGSVPLAGAAYFYLVRPESGCVPGSGPLGFQSNGTPRAGRACP